MNEYADRLSALLDGLRTHVDLSWAPNPLLTAGFALVAGLILALWGASLVRAMVVLAFIGAGVWGGRGVTDQFPQIAPIAGMLVGAFAGGVIGFFLFRLWIGLLSAVLFSAIGLGVLGSQQALPHLSAYDETGMIVGATDLAPFVVPTPTQQRTLLETDPKQYLRGFWDFASEREQTLPRNVLAVLAVATFFGVTIGLLLPTLMTVLWTSLGGTLLVAAASLWAINAYRPSLLQFLHDRPTIHIGVWVGFCVLTMIAQGLMRRPRRSVVARASRSTA